MIATLFFHYGFQASEGLLLEQLEKDRTEIKLLNDQLFESNYLNLKHKKYKNNELNDSLDSISNSLHSNFGTVFNSYNKSPDDRVNFFYFLEELFLDNFD